MKPSMTLSALLLGGAIVMGGCGGGSSSDTTTTNGSGGASSSANSGDSSSQSASGGTGYYLDSAVAGVSYTCGSETGKTDNDGKFTFEKGKGCTFEVAGIPLRQVPADELVDNAKIVENNVTVARFLQSIDTDGDLSNGIQITDEILDVLTKALQEENIKTVPDSTAKLEAIVSHIEQEDSNFNGFVVTEEDAQQHLQSTQTSVLKDLIIGKTYYIVAPDVNPQHVETLQFKSDGETLLVTWPKQGQDITSAFTYTIANGKLHIVGTSGDGDKVDINMFKGAIIQTDTYIKGANGKHFYKTKKAAEDALMQKTHQIGHSSRLHPATAVA